MTSSADSGPAPDAQLRRMNLVAGLLLVLMAALVVVGTAFRRVHPIMGFVQAFGEAGLVGGCADWFAIVALFHHPFGLPIPHTAILARNQSRIGSAIGDFIAQNFLTAEALESQVAKLDPARLFAQWLGSGENRSRLAEELSRLLPKLISAASEAGAGDAIGQALLRQVESIPAATTFAQLMAAFWDRGLATSVMDQGIKRAHAYLLREHEALSGRLAAPSQGWRPRWLNRFVTARVLDALAGLLQDMRRPDHPWRGEAREAYKSMLRTLAGDPAAAAKAEEIKAAVLEDPALRARLVAPWKTLERSLASDDPESREHARAIMERVLADLQVWLETPRAEIDTLNEHARGWIIAIITPRRVEIGAFFSDIVAKWDVDTLSSKIEQRVGPDLQYIRINGTLVGGLVGVLIHIIFILTGSV